MLNATQRAIASDRSDLKVLLLWEAIGKRNAEVLCRNVVRRLRPGLTGFLVVNVENGEYVTAKTRGRALMEARRNWGKKVREPTIRIVTLASESEYEASQL